MLYKMNMICGTVTIIRVNSLKRYGLAFRVSHAPFLLFGNGTT